MDVLAETGASSAIVDTIAFVRYEACGKFYCDTETSGMQKSILEFGKGAWCRRMH